MKFLFLLFRIFINNGGGKKEYTKERKENIILLFKLFIKGRNYTFPDFRYLKSENLSILYTYKTAMSIISPSLIIKDYGKLISPSQGSFLSKIPREGVDYYTFTIVRNPLERLVCCYKRKIVHPINPNRQMFRDIYLGGRLKYCKSFDEFINIILIIPNRLLEGHIAVNSDLIFDEQGKTKVDFIGKYENLYEDYKIIQDNFNLPDLVREKTPNPNWQDCYTLKTAKAVAKKYWKDIEMLNYQQEYYDLIKYLENKESKYA